MTVLERVVLVAAFFFATSCATTRAVQDDVGVKGHVADLPGLPTATGMAWEALGRADEPPAILIVEGADLNCLDTVSEKTGFETVVGCRGGFSFRPDESSIAWHPGERWSETALVHELRHQALVRTGRGSPIGDPSHKLPGWFEDPATCPVPPGDCGIVGRVNVELSNNGGL